VRPEGVGSMGGCAWQLGGEGLASGRRQRPAEGHGGGGDHGVRRLDAVTAACVTRVKERD
jgi:hypothetical protein